VDIAKSKYFEYLPLARSVCNTIFYCLRPKGKGMLEIAESTDHTMKPSETPETPKIPETPTKGVYI
jgi:hypothetical protein